MKMSKFLLVFILLFSNLINFVNCYNVDESDEYNVYDGDDSGGSEDDHQLDLNDINCTSNCLQQHQFPHGPPCGSLIIWRPEKTNSSTYRTGFFYNMNWPPRREDNNQHHEEHESSPRFRVRHNRLAPKTANTSWTPNSGYFCKESSKGNHTCNSQKPIGYGEVCLDNAHDDYNYLDKTHLMTGFCDKWVINPNYSAMWCDKLWKAETAVSNQWNQCINETAPNYSNQHDKHNYVIEVMKEYCSYFLCGGLCCGQPPCPPNLSYELKRRISNSQ
eukprot:TRINITY_DN11329_c0_g1_i1.p1 TRINITY_DN11329_c0_g1~~TRINITY_DN11329_c0_g1_i1.p1  ORF type:complete len:274 (-),score=45.86 TRINITY_DN11329_c0_g1_i1:25-846(-)